jgi:hypothetical protein
MDILLTGTELVIGHPERALAVSFVFLSVLVLLRFVRPGTNATPILLVPAAAWAVFALMEWEAGREGAYIRLDLLITWPAVWLISILSSVFCVARLLRRGAAKHPPSS